MPRPTAPQKCHYCPHAAEKSLIWADGRAYVPVCRAHEQAARRKIRSQGDSILDVKQVEQKPNTYREDFHPHMKMEEALKPAPGFAYFDDEEPGERFGLQADARRRESALSEAPRPDVAPYGRRSPPRGQLFRQRTGKDIRGITGKPIKRRSTDPIKTRSTDPHQVVTGKHIPDSLLKMLGTDWKSLRAIRVHDNRMTVNIDGVRYSLYTRRG